MLPKFLVGTYKQYKQDTKILATWLSVTARSMGYVSQAIPAQDDVVAADAPKKSKAKSKPKTKKQKRDAARRVPKEQRVFTISQKEFLPLAQYISVHLEPNSHVPSSILSMIKRVIEARKSSDDWFKVNTQEDDKDGHIHFIGILQDVYDTLQPHSAADSQDGIKKEDNLVDMDNLFEVLQLEEPSQQFLDAPAAQLPDHKRIRMVCEFVDVFFEHVESYFEESFAATSLFRDINMIYRHIEHTWCHFKEGKVDLMSAAITTNTAIELVRRLEEDFFEEFPRFRKVDEHLLKQFKRYDPKHTDAQQLINFMFRAKSIKMKKNTWNDDKSEAHFNLELYEDARYLFMDMHSIFLTYFIGSQHMSKCVYQAGPLGLWDPDVNYQDLTALEKHRQDRRILLEVLPDMALLSTSLSGIPPLAEDELLRGSRNFFAKPKKSPTVHLWMLVSLRVFCDIHHILGANIGKPFETIRRLGQSVDDAVEEALRHRAVGKTQIWPTDADETIRKNFLDHIQQSLFVDEVKDFIDDAARNVRGWEGKSGFELLRRHPWACGLMEFNIRAGSQEVGLVALDQSSSGITTAHLYNALEKQSVLQTLWPDMELFIKLIGNDQIFRGERPSNLEDYCTRLSLLRGISAETFARNRRDRGMIQSRRGHQQLFPSSGLITILKLRLAMVVNRPEATDEDGNIFLTDLEEVLNQRIQLVSDGSQAIVRARGSAEVDRLKRNPVERKYSPVELLMVLQFNLARELPSIAFDYLAFHKSCWEVLKAAYDVYGPILENGMPPVNQILQEYQSLRLTASVDCIFAMGMPLLKAQKMVRKVAMPNFPPITHEFQQTFDQASILKAVGKAVENKIVNGRLRILPNVRARKLFEARPEVVFFDIQRGDGDNDGKGNITFGRHKLWQHREAACTRKQCVCGVKGMPMLKPGWRRAMSDYAGKLLGNSN